MGEKVSKGDLLELSFTGTVAGRVFDRSEKPVAIFAGEGEVVKGLDEALLASEVGESKKISLAPSQAFGGRREELVRLVPFEKFRRNGVEPVAGMPVELDGMPARVQSVGGGRVRVDFNHELAGKTVEYEFRLGKKFVSAADKVVALAGNALPECGAKLADGIATITASASCRKDADYTMRKLRFTTRCLRFVAEVEKVVVQEEYDKAGGQV